MTRDGKDRYPWKLRVLVPVFGRVARRFRFADLRDQEEACRRVFASDPILKSNRTRRVDVAMFMVDARTDEDLVREAPAIVGCKTPSALVHADEAGRR